MIRPMSHFDLEMVLAWRNNINVRRYMNTQHEITLDEHKSWFKRTLQDSKNHLLIFEVNQKALGFISIIEAKSEKIARWGFYAAPEAPKGCGRLLGTAALSYAFADLKLNKIYGTVLANNQRSINLHLALGFKKENLIRDQYLDGIVCQSILSFVLLSSDWQISN